MGNHLISACQSHATPLDQPIGDMPYGEDLKLITTPVTGAEESKDFASLSNDMRFAAAVAGAAQLLCHDPYIKDFSYDRAIAIANDAKGKDEYGYRAEFVQLLRAAKLADKAPAP